MMARWLRIAFLKTALAGIGVTMCAQVIALTPLPDQELADVSGSGIAISTEDFRVSAGPTTYFEISGGPPPTGSLFQETDGRYYGITLSGDQGLGAWGGFCGAGINDMGCPLGGTIPHFSPFDNPFIFRVASYDKWDYLGFLQTQSVLELLAPTDSDPWRLATWSEFTVDNDTSKRMQGQILLSNSKLSVTQPNLSAGRSNNSIRVVEHSDPLDPTVGFIWHNSYQGDFRFSINQHFLSPDHYGVPPIFGASEGFYALNVQAYMPLGQMFYQDIILKDSPTSDGNFSIELTAIPDQPAAYSDFYSLALADAVDAGYERSGRPERYYETHGFFLVGSDGTLNNNGTSGALGTKTTDTNDGIFFIKGDTSPSFTAAAHRPEINTSCVNGDTGSACLPPADTQIEFNNLNQVNIGDVMLNGILFNHLELITCSAGSGINC